MKRFLKFISLLTLLFLEAVTCPRFIWADSVKDSDPVGIWKADFESKLAEKPQRLVLYIEKNSDSQYEAKFDWPQITAIGEKIRSIGVHDGLLIFDFLGDASFAGKIDSTGNQMVGNRMGHWWEAMDGKSPQYVNSDAPLTFVRLRRAPEYKRPQEPKKPYPYIEKEITFNNENANVTFAGSLTLPTGKGPFPAVLFTSFGAVSSRNTKFAGHNEFLVLSDTLTRHGVAVLRFDSRGGGGSSKGNVASPTDEDFAEDVLAGVNYLKNQKEINSKQIGLLGSSEGGRVALLAAAQSKDISFAVLLATSGLTGGENTALQFAAIHKAYGDSDAEIAHGLKIIKTVVSGITRNKDKDEVALKNLLEEISDKEIEKIPKNGLEKTGASEELRYFANLEIGFLSTPWGRFYTTNDPGPILKKLQLPVLAVGGGKDLQVPPDENLKAIKEALEAGKNKDFSIVEIPDLNYKS